MIKKYINFQSIFYIILFIIGFSQVVPGHNLASYLPPFKAIIDECKVYGPQWKIRLYEQNLGSTTSYSYFVTAQRFFFTTEYTIYDTYGFPVISSISCEGNELGIITISETQDKYIISDDISDFIQEPIILYYGKPQSDNTNDGFTKSTTHFLRLTNMVCCFPLLIPGISLGVSIYRKYMDNHDKKH